ncbi:hypothetical protein ACES2L_03780 [Bdellovibrio bacteriovorus]
MLLRSKVISVLLASLLFTAFFSSTSLAKETARKPASVLTLTKYSPNGVIDSTSTALLSVTSSETATCKFSQTDQKYESMPLNFATTRSVNHSHLLSGLMPNKVYTYYIACLSYPNKVASPIVKVRFQTAPVLDVTGYDKLGSGAFLANVPNNYSPAKSCAIYKFFDSNPSSNLYVAENFSKYATGSVAACKAFIKKHYLTHEGCGGLNVSEAYSVVGVLKNTSDGALKFDTSRGLQNISISQGTSVIAMNAAKCITAKEYNMQKGSLWSKAPRCDYNSTQLCVNPNTPLLSQSAPQLATHIAKATGNANIKRDMGWCGAVSLTMSALGAIYSSDGEIFQDSFFWKKNLPSHSQAMAIKDLNERTAFYADTIYNVGQLAGTDWAAGGTFTNSGLSNILGHLDPSITNLNKSYYDGEVLRRQYSISTEGWNFNELIKLTSLGQNNSFARGKAVARDCFAQKIVKVRTQDKLTFWEGSEFKCEWKSLSASHALSVNGIEEGYVKIYDPWGKVYNLKVIENTIVPSLNMKIALGVPVGTKFGETGYFRDSGKLDATLPADFVQKVATSDGKPPVIRKTENYFYIAVYGYQTTIVGKKK